MNPPSTKVKTWGQRECIAAGGNESPCSGAEEKLKVSPFLVFFSVGYEAGQRLSGPLAKNWPWLTFNCALFS